MQFKYSDCETLFLYFFFASASYKMESKVEHKQILFPVMIYYRILNMVPCALHFGMREKAWWGRKNE